jgi:hypothetical protein
MHASLCATGVLSGLEPSVVLGLGVECESHPIRDAWLQFSTTETAVVDKPEDEDEYAGHHHGHAH